MNMNALQEKIKNVMAIVFEADAAAITDEASPDTIENWDSLRHLNLAVALEEAFGIELSEEDIMELMNFKLVELKVREKTGNA
jgi:acyl carrier protein